VLHCPLLLLLLLLLFLTHLLLNEWRQRPSCLGVHAALLLAPLAAPALLLLLAASHGQDQLSQQARPTQHGLCGTQRNAPLPPLPLPLLLLGPQQQRQQRVSPLRCLHDCVHAPAQAHLRSLLRMQSHQNHLGRCQSDRYPSEAVRPNPQLDLDAQQQTCRGACQALLLLLLLLLALLLEVPDPFQEQRRQLLLLRQQQLRQGHDWAVAHGEMYSCAGLACAP
jgi:hypothetical protein